MKKLIAMLTVAALLISCFSIISFADESTGVEETIIRGIASAGGVRIDGTNDKTSYSKDFMYTEFDNKTQNYRAYGVIRFAMSEIAAAEDSDEYWFSVAADKQSTACYDRVMNQAFDPVFAVYEVGGMNDTWTLANGLTASQMSSTGDKNDITFKEIGVADKKDYKEYDFSERASGPSAYAYFQGVRINVNLSDYFKTKIEEFNESGKEEEYITLAVATKACYDKETGEEYSGFYQPVFRQVGYVSNREAEPRITAKAYSAPETYTKVFYETTDNNDLRSYVFSSFPSGLSGADFDDIGVVYSRNGISSFGLNDVDGESVKKLSCINREFSINKFGVGITDKRDLATVGYVKPYYVIGDTVKYGEVQTLDMAKGLFLDASNTKGKMYPEFSINNDDYYVTSSDGTFEGIECTLADGAEISNASYATANGETTSITAETSSGLSKTLRFHYVAEANGSALIDKSAQISEYFNTTPQSISTKSTDGVVTVTNKTSLYMIDRKALGDDFGLFEFDISDVNILADNIYLQLVGYNRGVLPCDFDIYAANADYTFEWANDTITYDNAFASGKYSKGEKIATASSADIAEDIAVLNAAGSGNYYKVESLKFDVTDAVKEAKLSGQTRISFIIAPNGSYWEADPVPSGTAKTFYLTNAYCPYDNYKPALLWSFN